MVNKILKIEEITTDDFVYDIENPEGNYVCGTSKTVVYQSDSCMNKYAATCDVKYGDTDSIYCLFKFPDKLSKEENLKRTWELASECADRISYTFKNPIELEMEKIMWPLYLYGKKRYASKIYEKKRNGTFSEKRDLKGIQAVRRDNCKLVKTISKPVFDMLLDNNDIEGAIDVIKDYVRRLLKAELHIDEFVITKSINSTYKTVNKKGGKVSLPGHVLLAEVMKKRKVMNPPQVGDRIPFIYIETDNPKANGGERMEDPNYLIENPDKCKLDAIYYMEKQIASPLYTIFEVLVKDSNGDLYPRKIKTDKNTGKITTEITKECKWAIDELLWNDIIREFAKCPNFFIKKKKIDTGKQTKITSMFLKK
jgi:DNA polymerase delta subunit 1